MFKEYPTRNTRPSTPARIHCVISNLLFPVLPRLFHFPKHLVNQSKLNPVIYYPRWILRLDWSIYQGTKQKKIAMLTTLFCFNMRIWGSALIWRVTTCKKVNILTIWESRKLKIGSFRPQDVQIVMMIFFLTVKIIDTDNR